MPGELVVPSPVEPNSLGVAAFAHPAEAQPRPTQALGLKHSQLREGLERPGGGDWDRGGPRLDVGVQDRAQRGCWGPWGDQLILGLASFVPGCREASSRRSLSAGGQRGLGGLEVAPPISPLLHLFCLFQTLLISLGMQRRVELEPSKGQTLPEDPSPTHHIPQPRATWEGSISRHPHTHWSPLQAELGGLSSLCL